MGAQQSTVSTDAINFVHRCLDPTQALEAPQHKFISQLPTTNTETVTTDTQPRHSRTESCMSSHVSLSLDLFEPVSIQDDQPQQEKDQQQQIIVDEQVIDQALARIAPQGMVPFLKSASAQQQQEMYHTHDSSANNSALRTVV